MKLYGSKEVSELLGISQQNLYKKVNVSHTFPQPYQRLAATDVWTDEQIQKYLKKEFKEDESMIIDTLKNYSRDKLLYVFLGAFTSRLVRLHGFSKKFRLRLEYKRKEGADNLYLPEWYDYHIETILVFAERKDLKNYSNYIELAESMKGKNKGDELDIKKSLFSIGMLNSNELKEIYKLVQSS